MARTRHSDPETTPVDPDTGLSSDMEARAHGVRHQDGTRAYDPSMQQLAADMLQSVDPPKVYREEFEVPDEAETIADLLAGAPDWIDPGWGGMNGSGVPILNVPLNGNDVQPYSPSPARAGDTITRYTDEGGKSIYRITVNPFEGYDVIDGPPPEVEQPDGGVGEPTSKRRRKQRELEEVHHEA